MSKVELKMRFNPETEEVETLVDGKVLVSSGTEAFKSWVEWHNEKHTVAAPVEEKLVIVERPVEEPAVDPQNPVSEEVDNAETV